MKSARAAPAAPFKDTAAMDTHSIPRFEGPASRRHRRVGLRALRLRAVIEGSRRAFDLTGVHTMVQFAGWPRSGHSLVGALLDAHPEAVVAHELDAMGLFAKGLPASRLPALMAWSAAEFARNGKWWNGFCYAVADAPPPRSFRVVGDKKGDWAARWSAREPDLAARLKTSTRLRCAWVLVTRAPLDNVATMSLRQGGTYDQLRIAGGAFDDTLRAAQARGEVAQEMSDVMVADYDALAAATALIKARVSPADWIEIPYERFSTAPRDELARLAGFLDLAPDPAWLDAAVARVRSSRNASRHLVTISPDQRAALARTIADHDFLRPYADDL